VISAPAYTGFRCWHAAGFTSELLPIIPPGATLTPGTEVQPQDRGKTPGAFTRAGTWSGLGGKWSKELHATVSDLKAWQGWGASVGLQSRTFLGLDIDIEDEAAAARVESLAVDYLGLAPIRVREGSSRRLLMYRRPADHQPIRKTRAAWTDKAGVKQAVELLGFGQQFVVEGPHPKGGEYRWLSEHPCACGPAGIGEVTQEHVDAFFAELARVIDAKGWAATNTATTTATGATGSRKGLDNVALHAPRPELVLDALAAWPNTADNVPTHDDFVAALAAIKAALGSDREDHYGAVEDWALGYDGNDADYVRKTWDSITDAAVGWEWLAGAARASGFAEDAQEDFADDEAAADSVEAANAAIGETPIERMTARYVWVGALGRYNDTNGGGFLGSREFNAANVAVSAYGNSGRQTAEAIFQNTPGARKVAAATSRPGEPIITTDENERGAQIDAVNLWRPSPLKPARGATDADVAPWLDLVERLFGAERAPEREHFLNWLAFVLQNPGRKIGHALVIIGGQGVGKDTVLAPFFEAVGLHNVAPVDTATLAGQWTFYLKAQIVYGQEIITHGRRDLYNHLKPFISGQKTRLVVNEKGLRQYTVPNHQNWIITTNHDNALALEDDDRRFWVHRVLLEEPPAEDYFATLYAWFDGGGSGRVFGWLLRRDVSGFNPMARPPMTTAKQTMLDQSQPAAVRWLRAHFAEDGALASRTIVTAADLASLADQDFAAPEINGKHPLVALKAEGFKPAHRVRLDGGMRQLWVRDPSGLLSQLSADKLRERYASEAAETKARVRA
jgi:Family of unknown function (DUF5906)/Bifunctional DNA primase/polymerase, N-terminal